VADTVQKVVALAPDDITLHALALKRGSRLKLKLDEHEAVSLPSDEETRRMAKAAEEPIKNAGYIPYYLTIVRAT